MGMEILLIAIFVVALLAYFSFSLISLDALVHLSPRHLKEEYVLPPLTVLCPSPERLIAILNFNGTGKIGLFIALLGAVLLMAMLIDLKSKAKSDTSVKSSDLDFNMGMKITVDGTAWFYLCMILFLTAAFFSWQRSKVKT